MLRNIPPFRADHVGSLLRPQELREARAKRGRGEIKAEQLKAVEDRAIKEVIAKQEATGLKGVTDGEYRREFWHIDFLAGLDGGESYQADHGIKFQGGETKPLGLRVTGKIGYSGHPMIEHFKFLKEHTKNTPKMTIPSPSALHFRRGREAGAGSLFWAIGRVRRVVGRALSQ